MRVMRGNWLKSFWRGVGIDYSEGVGWFGFVEGFGGVVVVEVIVIVVVLLVYGILNVWC